MNALQLWRWQFSHKETLQQTFFKRSSILDGNRPFCVFEPLLGDLGATYDDHLRLIGKCVVDFLLVLIELFFARCYGRGATGENRLKIGDFDPTAVGWPKLSSIEGVAPTNHSSSQKTRLNDFSYDIKIWFDLSSILSRITRLTDGQTDRQTEFSSLDRVCIPCSAVRSSGTGRTRLLQPP